MQKNLRLTADVEATMKIQGFHFKRIRWQNNLLLYTYTYVGCICIINGLACYQKNTRMSKTLNIGIAYHALIQNVNDMNAMNHFKLYYAVGGIFNSWKNNNKKITEKRCVSLCVYAVCSKCRIK